MTVDSHATFFDLKNLQPLSDRFNIDAVARRLFTNGIIFTKHDYANDHRFFQMSYEELLQRTDKPQRYHLPNDRGVIFLGQHIALIPIAVYGDHNIVTWRCEICCEQMSQEDFINRTIIPDLSPRKFVWDRTYLDRECDQDIKATTALVFHGKDRPSLPFLGPTVIY
ncbi:hypothetical protein BDV40DRAFT_298157 [Aspergillus tamarii]|uniref:Uncharacterized protein n=1 Tax=Aspergillus tamarii TaxID=41984 RepID=A0A5N6V2I1_ASPTM|nr:hypothetical protein BDV40DRAFT_298157 [Aspergillus tamarii]